MQAQAPAQVRDKLKPWQLEGLRHMYVTTIVDHDVHARQQAQRSQEAEAADDADDVNPSPAGCILAHTMGAGKTLQVWPALLFRLESVVQELCKKCLELPWRHCFLANPSKQCSEM